MSDLGLRRLFLIVLLWLAAGSPAVAQTAAPCGSAVTVCSAPAAIVLADSWSIGKFVSGGGRGRIVQVCVVVMCIALFIIMRKLN